MSGPSDRRLEEFVLAAHRVAGEGLVLCGSGNLSWRLDGERMLITATQAWLGELTVDQVALCTIRDGASLNGKRPSVEAGFHRGILGARQDVNVVLHFQSPCATAMACRKTQSGDTFQVTPEVAYYIGPVAIVPYKTPGSAELAAAVTGAMRDHNLAILRNHGQVTVGGDFKETLERAVHFEFAAAICLRLGEDVDRLGAEDVGALYRARQESLQALRSRSA